MSPGLGSLGSLAPTIAIHGATGAHLLTPRGRPRVLAFVRRWHAPSDIELARLRALMRGLGAELSVISPTTVWTLAPDDAPRADGIDDPGAAAAAYGVSFDHDAVFVIGGDRRIRFAHVPEAPLATSLLDALESAVDALHSRRTPPVTFTRREWSTSCLVSGFALVLLSACRGSSAPDRAAPPPAPAPPVPAPAPAAPPAPADLDIVLDINGTPHPLTIDPRTSLLDALRERLGMTGTKKGCDGGQCGACTVHLGGQRVVSCLTLAAVAEGQKITTIEGLSTGDQLHPMQAAFIAHDAFQCGFCTPGQIMSAVAFLSENHERAWTDDDIREHMSGNLCRCGAYPNIVAAVRAASQTTAKRG